MREFTSDELEPKRKKTKITEPSGMYTSIDSKENLFSDTQLQIHVCVYVI